MNEPARWATLLLAIALAIAATRVRGSARAITWIAAVSSALLSALYIPVYLRSGPRIIDATTYWLEARALAEGHLAWPVGDPEAATVGRFLVRDTLAALPGAHVAAIFPPGYPAVLALGFLVHAPMAIGPMLAAGITFATAHVARALADEVAFDPVRTDAVQATAAVLAAASATLRYHTADTMSHGLAALLFTGAVLGALRVVASRTRRSRFAFAGLLGGALGGLVATRPVSGIACAIAVAAVLGTGLLRRRVGGRDAVLAAAIACASALPPLALLLAHQRAATGAWLHSAQSLYYAANDGPPGCFRYGFGAGIGCRLEHGPYVAHNLNDGYGLLPALHTTGVRLWVHAGDALNVFALGPVTLVAVALAGKTRGLRVLAIGPLAQIALYAPFYFDGSYPGSGARFYVDALPLELVAMAFAAVALATWIGRRAIEPTRKAWIRRTPLLLGALSLAGFALRGATEHELLRDRDGGAPMFDAAFVERELGARGPEAPRPVVFVSTDHGFGLAFDPDRGAAYDVARVRGEAIDRMTMDALGATEAFRYAFSFDGAPPRVTPYAPRGDAPVEVEALHPPVEQVRGWSFTLDDPDASDGRELGVALDREGRATIVLAVPGALAGRTVVLRGRGAAHLEFRRGASRDAEVDASWANEKCSEDRWISDPIEVPRDGAARRLEIDTRCPVFRLDAIDVKGTSGAAPGG